MLDEKAIKKLEKQKYRVVGKNKHSTVKTCGWTRSALNGQGSCYKGKFYGIQSHQCLQMTPSMSCANRCIFCWRDYKAPVSREWKWKTDSPEEIFEEALKAHHKLLIGFKNNKKTNKTAYRFSKYVKHVALSLSGEPIIYPKINELINLFHKNKISTFLVTNGQHPEAIKNLAPVTQLYLSLDAPTKLLLKKIDVPLFNDYWERLNKSLEYLSKKKHRTCIRLTLIKDYNMSNDLINKYAELILKGSPDFIEVKSYMHVGASQERLERENMPLHEEIVEFSKKLVKHLNGYGIASEHIPSRVVLIAKNKYKNKNNKWDTLIDFKKLFE